VSIANGVVFPTGYDLFFNAQVTQAGFQHHHLIISNCYCELLCLNFLQLVILNTVSQVPKSVMKSWLKGKGKSKAKCWDNMKPLPTNPV
jgi:hypothetical protein